ncbi:MAG: hypothetical protein IJA65_04850 [Acholeplasmatales bacterium]|nr:hypothetical protein [Acholeplasmatales bacterium]
MYRLIDCLCHPSRVGLYYKDKIHILIIYLVSFCLALTSIMVINSYSSSYFSKSASDNVSQMIINSEDKANILYENNILTGDELVITSDNYEAYFFKSNFKKNTSKIIMHFQEEKVDIFYGIYKLNTYLYSESTAKGFNLENVQNGILKDTLEFEAIVSGAFDSVDKAMSHMNFYMNMVNVFFTYVVILVIGIIYSYFTNPTIQTGYRIKLCIYSSLIFFVIMIFSILFSISWLQYVAFALPVFYIGITFSHIVKVNVKKV